MPDLVIKHDFRIRPEHSHVFDVEPWPFFTAKKRPAWSVLRAGLDFEISRLALRLERASASAGLDCVGVLEREALFFQAVVPIDGRTV